MRSVIEQIKANQYQRQDSPFFVWLLDDQVPMAQKLGKVPYFLHFTMMFRDLLRLMKKDPPRTQAERLVNQHISEDWHHWKYFAHDLQTLSFSLPNTTMASGWQQLLKAHFVDIPAPRDLIYHGAAYVLRSDSALVNLSVLLALESYFSLCVQRFVNKYKEHPSIRPLKFFGWIHVAEEGDHAVGHWEGDAYPGLALSFSSEQEENLALEAAASVCQHFDIMFDALHHANPVLLNAVPDEAPCNDDAEAMVH